ncbi:MAG: CopG family transcriptional regulator [Anaerolineae bacterium CG1_02_58_13]|nr:MAG: CopG family transcriptional regulator [Anaerolineae bacterium CG1_02_58_13]
MKASELDQKFDDNQNILDSLDLSQARRPALEQKRVNVDFPAWMIAALDREARKLGVTRQSVIKMWLAERLQQGR